MEGVLKRALASGKPVEIIYEAKDGRLSHRPVTVHRMNEKDIFRMVSHQTRSSLFENEKCIIGDSYTNTLRLKKPEGRPLVLFKGKKL
ncbi:hypothetical protein [Alteribacillus sp. YIM 98480]|uniref:hypothetical protein n=1 Tax=Alteribacillus sp. YIM 98480 TaxID=2606599 RepID=UPI00131E46EB|nr:hypothetical protein [Alteribacillus sp. YIM 98480]